MLSTMDPHDIQDMMMTLVASGPPRFRGAGSLALFLPVRTQPNSRGCFGSWTQASAQLLPGAVVAIDGKTARRSHDTSGNKGPYTWSAPGPRRTP